MTTKVGDDAGDGAGDGEVRLDCDSFNYSRAGLELREPCSFTLRRKNRITIVRLNRPGFPEDQNSFVSCSPWVARRC
jgi:hypothetical protein